MYSALKEQHTFNLLCGSFSPCQETPKEGNLQNSDRPVLDGKFMMVPRRGRGAVRMMPFSVVKTGDCSK
jgi:hypothetical protein